MGGNKKIGEWGEGFAATYLESKGFKIIARSFHTLVGELDIVAVRGKELYGIEVKTRAVGAFDNDQAITSQKKERLIKTLKKYCFDNRIDSEEVFLAGIIIGIDRVFKKVKIRWVLIY